MKSLLPVTTECGEYAVISDPCTILCVWVGVRSVRSVEGVESVP